MLFNILNLCLLFGFCVAFNFGLTRILRKKRIFQPIYESSPVTHQKKDSIPSFGGVGILLSVLAGIVLLSIQDSRLLWVSGLIFLFGILGFIDDYLSVSKGKNKGLSARHKLLCQTGIAILGMWVYDVHFQVLSIGVFVFYVFVIVGASNAANMTDGLDGLLAGLSLITLSGFWLYTRFIHWEEASYFCLSLMLGVLAFLVFNV
ncbi:MAG: hypothetical protein HRT90_02650, partial [Candidatus Margulisbacteria bacterium]|nr:hypothetical protein [Candidatus Margulisiibacteriota bacterium]